MNKPNWNDAPEWATYLAQDESGYWYWFEREPALNQYAWFPIALSKVEFVYHPDDAPNKKWRETLESKP